MFHAPIGRFQLELVIFIAYFSTVAIFTNCVFFPVGLSSLMRQICWKFRINDERPTGKKTKLVSGTMVEKNVIKINISN